MTLYTVFTAVGYFLYAIRTAILVYCIMSWFRPRNRFFYFLARFVEPFIAPFRRISMWVMTRTRLPIDFTCWFAIIGISLINRLMWWIYTLLIRIR